MRPNSGQSGQTLIETIVAIFVLATALTTGLAVAISALGNSSLNFQQITAVSLAREGTEVIRMMRDSNWLASEVSSNPNLKQTACGSIGGRICYPDAFKQDPSNNSFYSLDPAGNYRINYNAGSNVWSLDSTASWNLYLQNDGSYSHSVNGTSQYARMIAISKNTAAPFFDIDSNWELIIKSVVAWRGKGCPDFTNNTDLLLLSSKCKIVVEEHLTNWKDYPAPN